MSRHLTHDELLNRIYLAEPWGPHLENCRECQTRFAEYQSRRAATIPAVEVEDRFLARQRQAILQRMDEPPRSRRAWVPALAASVLLAVALWWTPSSAPKTKMNPAAAMPAAEDEKFFSEIYSIENSDEPLAAAPIRELFVPVSTEEAN